MLRENISAASKLFVQIFVDGRSRQVHYSEGLFYVPVSSPVGESFYFMASATPLTTLDGCMGCKARSSSAFCNLPEAALGELDRLSFAVSYPEHAILFTEEQICKGTFLVCSGKVKLSARAQDGKEFMLQAALSGQILGLSAAIAGVPYGFSALTLAPSTIRFVRREDFLQFLKFSPDSALNAVHALSFEYDQVLTSLRSIALLHTASARIAQLLLRMAAGAQEGQESNVRLLLTQEQIAQMTGTTRETVTRFFAQLKRENVIDVRGSSLVIRDRYALERIAS